MSEECSTINFDYFSFFSYQLRMYINKYSQQFDYMLICLKGFVAAQHLPGWCRWAEPRAPLNLLRFFCLVLKSKPFVLASKNKSFLVIFLSFCLKTHENLMRNNYVFWILFLCSFLQFFVNFLWDLFAMFAVWGWARVSDVFFKSKVFSIMRRYSFWFNNFPFMHMSIIAVDCNYLHLNSTRRGLRPGKKFPSRLRSLVEWIPRASI